MANNQQTSTKVLVLLCLGSFWFYETKLFDKLNQKFVLINLTKKYFLLHLFLVGCTLFSILFLNQQSFTKQLCWKDLTNKYFLLHLFWVGLFFVFCFELKSTKWLNQTMIFAATIFCWLFFVFHFVCCPGGVKQTLQRTREVVSLCSPISLAAELGVWRVNSWRRRELKNKCYLKMNKEKEYNNDCKS